MHDPIFVYSCVVYDWIRKVKKWVPCAITERKGMTLQLSSLDCFAVPWSSTFIFMTKIIAMLRVWAKIILKISQEKSEKVMETITIDWQNMILKIFSQKPSYGSVSISFNEIHWIILPLKDVILLYLHLTVKLHLH